MTPASVLSDLRRGLDVLFEPDTVAEVRIPHTRQGTVSGYFNNPGAMAAALAKWDGKAPGLYITLNPVDPRLLARSVNRLAHYSKLTTSDSDILRRRWFALDFDPLRPAGISATDAEHAAALARAREVRDHLAGRGWPDPVCADSGNGGHLLYRVDLPNDGEAMALLTRGLEAVAFLFSDAAVSADVKVANAARIWKVPGSMACKGDATAERPHRRSQLLEVPAALVPVPRELLEALAAMAPRAARGASRNGHSPQGFDIERWIAQHQLAVVTAGPWNGGGRKWILNPCPWNPDHTNRAAYIVQHASGAIAAGCHHTGCAGKDWPALRTLLDPGWREGKEAQAGLRDEDEPGSSLPALDAPVTVLRAARNAGQPIPTGLPVLDERLHGGIRAGKAIAVGGTAGVGKTALLIQVGKGAAETGCAVAALMSDEGREPAIIRLGQQCGYPREALEAGQEAALDALEQTLRPSIFRFPDPDGEADATLEGAAESLARAYPDRPRVLLVDSLQTVRTRREAQEFPSLRERIMHNARTARRLAVEHHLAVIYTSEVNRGWYRARKEEDRSSDLAAFAEARIEFSADVLLLMRSAEEDPDLVEIRIPKNRLGERRPFLVRLDRARSLFAPVEGDLRQGMRDVAEAHRMETAKGAIRRELQAHPRVTRTQLRELVGGRGTVFSAALGELRAAGVVVVETEGRRVLHSLAEAPKS